MAKCEKTLNLTLGTSSYCTDKVYCGSDYHCRRSMLVLISFTQIHKSIVLLNSLWQKKQQPTYSGTHKRLHIGNALGYYGDHLYV